MYPPNGQTGIRGQFVNVMQRTEYQRRGPKHRHINEFPVTCGRLPEMPTLPMTPDSTQDFTSPLGVPSYLTTHERLHGKKPSSHLTKFRNTEDVTKDKQRLCQGFSTLCLKVGQQCRHPECTNGVDVYTKNHLELSQQN